MLVDRSSAVPLFALGRSCSLSSSRCCTDAIATQSSVGSRPTRRPRAARRDTEAAGHTPVEIVLRLLAVERSYGWTYAEVERFVGHSSVLRQFCPVYLERVPGDTTLPRWADLIEPATLAALDEQVVALACGLQATRGRKLRLGGTVVATVIHHTRDRTAARRRRAGAEPAAPPHRAVLGGAAAGLGQTVCRTRTYPEHLWFPATFRASPDHAPYVSP